MTSITAFDSDVLIYAASADHALGPRIAALFTGEGSAGIGSVLLLTETLAKPMRQGVDSDETAQLIALIARLDLRPLDDVTARVALSLAVRYGLRAADAAHLATAVVAGADRFLTNNRKDFTRAITEIDVIYPDQLPAG